MASGGRYRLVDEPLYRIRHHNSPSRVGNREKKAGGQMRVWCSHAKALLASEIYQLTPDARHQLGSDLYQCAIYAYRGGVGSSEVKPAFDLAKDLTPSPDYIERAPYKALAKVTSPLFAERTLSLIRAAVRGKRF